MPFCETDICTVPNNIGQVVISIKNVALSVIQVALRFHYSHTFTYK